LIHAGDAGVQADWCRTSFRTTQRATPAKERRSRWKRSSIARYSRKPSQAIMAGGDNVVSVVKGSLHSFCWRLVGCSSRRRRSRGSAAVDWAGIDPMPDPAKYPPLSDMRDEESYLVRPRGWIGIVDLSIARSHAATGGDPAELVSLGYSACRMPGRADRAAVPKDRRSRQRKSCGRIALCCWGAQGTGRSVREAP